jgi:colanic acid/amylovoran biosynthesis protein
VADADLAHRTITGRYMISPGGYIADVLASDLILDICGGDSFTDIYPDKRFAYVATTKIIPILAGTPLVLSPQTIGPFSAPAAQRHCRVDLPQAPTPSSPATR